MTAAASGNADVLHLLLARGANVNDAEPFQGLMFTTALMWAASGRQTPPGWQEQLIEFGAGRRREIKKWFHSLFVRCSQRPDRNRFGPAP